MPVNPHMGERLVFIRKTGDENAPLGDGPVTSPLQPVTPDCPSSFNAMTVPGYFAIQRALARSYSGSTLGKLASICAMRVAPAGWVESHCGGAPLLAAPILFHSDTPACGL